MTGNAYVLLALVEATLSFLPTVGPAAARRSRAIVRRTSSCRTALTVRVTAAIEATRAGQGRTDRSIVDTACAAEALAP